MHDIANHILENISQSKSSQQKYLRFILDHSCKGADGIIVPSIATKNDLVEHFSVEPRKISVIYEGGDKETNVKPAGEQELNEKYQIKKPYFLYVGTLQPRKNIETIVDAYKKKIKIVHTLRDYHLLCPFTSLHCSKVEDECPYVPPKVFCRMHRAINRVKSKYVDVVTAPSSVTLNLLTNNQFFASSEKKVVPNATEFDISEIHKLLERRKTADTHSLKFVYLGTLSKPKGIQWMISSFNDLSEEAEYFVCGFSGQRKAICRNSICLCIKRPI